MSTSTILSDNGVSSGTTGLKTAGGDDGNLILQTTSAGGTATTALTINTTQVVTLVNALPAGSGGTGANTLTAESVVIGNGTSAVKFVAPGTNGNVLTSNGTAWLSQAAGSSGVSAGAMTVFSSPGTWTKPASVKFIKVTVVASGGVFSSPGSGSTGNTSSFGPFVSCTGGTGNGPGSPTASGSKAGGTSTGGDWNIPGSAGGTDSGSPVYIGYSGGSLLTIGPGQAGGAVYGGGSMGIYGGGCTPGKSGGGGGATGIKYISAPSIPGPVTVTVGAGASASPSTNPSGQGIVIVEEYS